MRAALRDAQPGLRTDKLSPEAFPLLLPGQRAIGDREQPKPTKATNIENSAGYSYG